MPPSIIDNHSDITLSSQSYFEQSLGRETLRSELWRITLICITMVVLIVVVLLLTSVPSLVAPDIFNQISGYRFSCVVTLILIIVYELLIRAWYTRLLATQRQPFATFRYINAFIEMSMPTVFLFLGASAMDPLSILQAATPFVYFLFIAFVAMQLDFKLCLFAGVVAGGQFFIVAMIALQDAVPVEGLEILVAPHQYFVKSIVMVLVGVVTGFVAIQIRRQFSVSLQTLQERDRAINLFGQHVSPQVAEKLLSQPLESTGETRHVCVMFLDIRDFSKYAATHEPEEVVDYLNQLFSPMIDVINLHHGIVNKFLGDGFMAVFGAPMDDPEQCRHAVEASMRIIEQMKENIELGLIPETRIGIGLHAGDAVTGNVGSSQRKEYTIIGDAVNLASRIEQATKQFKAQVLISEQVLQLIEKQNFEIQDLGAIELKGQSVPVHVYQLA